MIIAIFLALGLFFAITVFAFEKSWNYPPLTESENNMSKRGKIKNKLRRAKHPKQVGPTYVITLDVDLRDPESKPRTRCTCGWVSEPGTLLNVGNQAKQHAMENPGHMFRYHPEAN